MKTTTQKHLGMCKGLHQQIRSMWGDGWKLLGDDLKRAVIAERVLHLFMALDGLEGSTVSPAVMRESFIAAKHYFGIDTDVEV